MIWRLSVSCVCTSIFCAFSFSDNDDDDDDDNDDDDDGDGDDDDAERMVMMMVMVTVMVTVMVMMMIIVIIIITIKNNYYLILKLFRSIYSSSNKQVEQKKEYKFIISKLRKETSNPTCVTEQLRLLLYKPEQHQFAKKTRHKN